MEAGADFEQTREVSAHERPALGGQRDPRQDLEESRFSRAVATHDADHFALAHREIDIAQRPDKGRSRRLLAPSEPAAEGFVKRLPGACPVPPGAEAVLLP